MSNRDIAQWQEDFRAAPIVWATVDQDGNINNIYESCEAAMVEVNACPTVRTIHGTVKQPTIRQIPIHSMDLAVRRWTRK